MSWHGSFFDLANWPSLAALGWALLHFVWQGALAALVLWVALRLAHSESPKVRYGLTCACLMLMILCIPITWLLNYERSAVTAMAARVDSSLGALIAAVRPVSTVPPGSLPASQALPWLVAAWCVGVATRGAWAAAASD
jgi:hypothetical protein